MVSPAVGAYHRRGRRRYRQQRPRRAGRHVSFLVRQAFQSLRLEARALSRVFVSATCFFNPPQYFVTIALHFLRIEIEASEDRQISIEISPAVGWQAKLGDQSAPRAREGLEAIVLIEPRGASSGKR